MWPIQIKVHNIPNSAPEVVGIFKGMCKPTSAIDFFRPFVDEVLLHFDGIDFRGNKLAYKLRTFIADAPARAFSLSHVAHNARVPCLRCWVSGEYLGPGIMVFRGVDHRPRTNEEYSSRIDGEHHKEGECPLGRLPMNFVSQTVFDYMHLVCLGVMEKILQGIIDGKYGKPAKLSGPFIKMLSARLEQVKEFCPKDFARKPVDISKHGKYKATELRQILVYSGPAIFHGLVNSAVYVHFLLLHTAMRIYTDPLCAGNEITLAEKLIRVFVLRAEEVYNVKFLSYNIHGLLHLGEDVRRFGALDSYSAFPFENNMTYFRKCCKKPNQHLQQIAIKRFERKEKTVVRHTDIYVQVIGEHSQGPEPPLNFGNYRQYKKLVHGKWLISLNEQDNTVILLDSNICIVQNIFKLTDNGQHYLLVKRFNVVSNLFIDTCPSSLISVFLCSSLSAETTIINFDQVRGKCFRMPYWPNLPTKTCVQDSYVVAKILSTDISQL